MAQLSQHMFHWTNQNLEEQQTNSMVIELSGEESINEQIIFTYYLGTL